MEMGAYSFAANELGYANGATLAYSLFSILLYITYRITLKNPIAFLEIKNSTLNYKAIALVILFINLIALFIILIPFKGYQIWIGQIDKGAFRVNLGFFGSIAYMMVRSFIPAMICMISYLYIKKIEKTSNDKLILFLNFFVAFLFGASWGYKSSALFILLPGLILFFWNIKFISFLKFSGISVFLFVIFSFFFDNRSLEFNAVDILNTQGTGNALEAVIYRLTVLQGDACWKIWNLHLNGDLDTVQYHKVLISILGDKNIDLLFGVNQNDYVNFIQYHFGLLLTYLCGNSPDAIAYGYNVTGTVFSEGLIAGGIKGLVFFAIFAGFLTGLSVNLIKEAMIKNNPIFVSIITSYFCFNIFAWLIGGGVDSLFHISILTGVFLTYILLLIIVNISNKIIK